MGMALRIGVGFAACFLLLTAPGALAQHHDYRWRNAGLTGIRTYSFPRTQPAAALSEKGMSCESSLVQEQTNSAIAAELDRLGLRRDDDHPDAYVVARRRFDVRYTYYGPYAVGWGPKHAEGLEPTCESGWIRWNGWHNWNGGVYADLYDTLTIVLRDASGTVRWQGAQTKRVHTTLKTGERLNDQVTDIFKGVSVPGAVATTGER